MSLTSLYLAPTEADAAPALAAVEQVLRDLEIVDRALASGGLAAGAGFERHVVYAGCSPHLVMQPPADGGLQFCHVVLHGPFQAPRLVTGPNTVRPRCPACRARIGAWHDCLAVAPGATPMIPCPACGRCHTPWVLDWRGHAIGGRVLVELRNVFPAEATPSDRLMDQLRLATGRDWQFAWAGYLLD